MDSSSLKDLAPKLRVKSDLNPDSEDLDKQISVPKKATIPNLGERFRIEQVLGSGGMGTVYKVLDEESNSTFAVKVLKPEISSSRVAVKRFEQEVESASKLSHSNLVSVYSHGSTETGSPYLVMDYYEGDSLAALLNKQEKLDGKDALELFIQLGKALSHAHKKGVIHRDIKPTNVIISKSDEDIFIPRIVDFGIAKVLPTSNRETLNFTETGEVFGSPEYMSPEQCMGFSIDQRSDVYSFGCLMYETLTGKTPFAGQNPIQLVVKHINEDVEGFKPAFKKDKIVKELEHVVLRCLEKEPENRYQSMDELLADFTSIANGEPIPRHLTRKKVKPTLTSSQAYGGFILVAFALIALQGYISIYFSNIYDSASSLIMGALFLIGSYVFGSLSFGTANKITEDKSLKSWWQQSFYFSTFVLCSVMGTALFFTSVAPLLGIDYVYSNYREYLGSAYRWIQVLSAVSMAVSGFGCLFLSFDKEIGFKRFLLNKAVLLVALYVASLGLAPNLAARLPVAMGEVSTRPIAAWLFKRAAYIDSSYSKPLEYLYFLEMERGNHEKALSYVNKLLVLDSKDAFLYSKRSKAFSAMGNTMFALADNEQAQALRPLELAFIDERVDILLNDGQPMRCLAAIDRALYNYPGSLHFASLKASVYARLGRYAEAINVLNQVSRTRSNKNPFFHIQKGEYLRMLGETKLSKASYRQAIATSQIWWQDPELMPLVRAYACSRLGQDDLANQEKKEMKRNGLVKNMLKNKIYSQYSGLNPEW